MYSKAQESKTKQEFWTAFGGYMKPVPSAEGGRISWQNYKTGIKSIFFRMRAERDFASIGMEITHPDQDIQELLFGQFEQFKKLLELETKEPWEWKLLSLDEFGKTVSVVEMRLEGVNVMDEADWPAIISFFKPRIIALDSFWSNVKYGFEGLV
ncbi:DUF4268 domain-containing protein [Lunatibacter salilacus]|uniref:DUF4268 domain-containing protein n=1 Tax=Lunatibacter salilacus TaxID=2483804 RepID=UPI00131C9536|nr:DUF4268 domain-containing protein [Lunatibacter salilacus]